jgi:hypothetical protein
MTARIAEHIARWAPPLMVPVVILWAWYSGPETFHAWVAAPNSVMEDMLGIVLLLAIIGALHVLFRPETKRHKGLRAWLVVWTLGLVYFLGEDLNWGQYVFNWQPSDFFLEHNKEAETNLHNMSPWFNQKPRMLVQLWLLVAAVLVPLGWLWPKRATAKFVPEILWPTRSTLLLAAVATIIPVLEWIAMAIWGNNLGGVPFRFSEVQEFFFAWFFLLFAIDLAGRLRQHEAERAAAAWHVHAE